MIMALFFFCLSTVLLGLYTLAQDGQYDIGAAVQKSRQSTLHDSPSVELKASCRKLSWPFKGPNTDLLKEKFKVTTALSVSHKQRGLSHFVGVFCCVPVPCVKFFYTTSNIEC